jgi:hypothetical protein
VQSRDEKTSFRAAETSGNSRKRAILDRGYYIPPVTEKQIRDKIYFFFKEE